MTTVLEQSTQSKKTNFDDIPVVDIGSLVDGSDIDSVANKLRFVCENIGFLYVKNHGVEQKLIDDMFNITQQFFSLPIAEKNKIHIKNSNLTLRGYIGMYEENVDPENTKDYKECYDMGADTPSNIPFFGKNFFPTDTMPQFSEIATKYHDAMLDLGLKLARAIARSLDLPLNFFDDRMTQPITIQRLLHYPPQSGKINIQKMGIGAHTDYGFLTILCQDNIGGLQVLNHNQEWVSAPPVDGTFIINIGDLIQTLTGGLYVSTTHRVINESGQERYSMPFFMDMDFNALIDVVPTRKNFTTETVEPYLCGHHKFSRFADSYAHLENVDINDVLSNYDRA